MLRVPKGCSFFIIGFFVFERGRDRDCTVVVLSVRVCDEANRMLLPCRLRNFSFPSSERVSHLLLIILTGTVQYSSTTV